jgi:arylsulfatase
MAGKKDHQPWAPTRRDFFKAAGLTIVQMNLLWTSGGSLFPSSALAQETPAKPPTKLPGSRRAPNILLILNDQERYFDRLPPKYHLPGKERLQELGTEFTNQQISSCVCTSSRSNIYTGQHIQQTKMFDNLNFPWVEEPVHRHSDHRAHDARVGLLFRLSRQVPFKSRT